MASPQDDAALRGVARLALDDLVYLLNALTGASADQARDALLEAVPLIVERWGAAAAALAADWYEHARVEAGITGVFAPTIPETAQVGAMDSMIRWAVAPLYAAAPDMALVLSNLSGNVQAAVIDQHRETIMRSVANDSQAIGWVRHARPDACAFCRLLATRSDLYWSKESALFVSGASMGGRDYKKLRRLEILTNRDSLDIRNSILEGRAMRAKPATVNRQPLGEKFHNHCYCQAVPVFVGQQYTPPAYVQDWLDEYEAAKEAAGTTSLKPVLSKMRENNSALNH